MIIISQPIIGVSDHHAILSYYYDLCLSIYRKTKRTATIDKNKDIMFEAVNVLTHNHHHILSIYILPIYSLTYAELFTTVEEKIY